MTAGAKQPCPPPERLEALALGQIAGAEGAKLRAHTAACEKCRKNLEALLADLEREAAALSAAARPPAGEKCLDDESLARYLDGGGEERAAWEAHLAHCGACRARLTALYRELQWLRSNAPAPETSEYHTDTIELAGHEARRAPAATNTEQSESSGSQAENFSEADHRKARNLRGQS